MFFVFLAFIILFIVFLYQFSKWQSIKKQKRKQEVAKIMQKHRESISIKESVRDPFVNTSDNHPAKIDYKKPYQSASKQYSLNEKQRPIHDCLHLSIRYPSHGDIIMRDIDVYGLGRYGRCYYILAYCHARNERRTFKLQKFRNCIDLDTGEFITRVKDYILAFNPDVIDLTSEFEMLKLTD